MAKKQPSLAELVRSEYRTRKPEYSINKAVPNTPVKGKRDFSVRVSDGPSASEIGKSVLGVVKNAPSGIVPTAQMLGQGLLDLGKFSAKNAYLGMKDRFTGGDEQMRNFAATDFAKSLAANPGRVVAENAPVIGGALSVSDLMGNAIAARRAGDEATASRLEGLVVPMLAAGLVPGGKAVAKGERGLLREGVQAAEKATRSPSLLSAIRANGKIYTGATHLDALESIPDLAVRKAASLDANNRGFVNERGKFMNREKAADYARNFDLFSPDAPSWAKTAPEVISENLKLPEDFAVAKAPEGIIAYHGSPHSFDRFDISKIGTGEGAQAYGHGLYFAEAEPVAQSYRDALQQFIPTIDGVPVPEPVYERARKVSPNVDDYLSILQRKLERNREALQSPEEIERMLAEIEQGGIERDIAALAPHAGKTFGAAPSGSMYKVRLNVRPEALLDWDRRLSEQSDVVKDVVHSAVSNQMPWLTKENVPNATGEGLYHMLGFKSPQHTSEFWQKSGIPGIRYLDQSSRSAGDGTSNYVMFGDDLIDLLRKYAMGGSV